MNALAPFLRLATLVLCAGCWLATPAHAIVVTATQNTQQLLDALLGGGGSGIVVTSISLNGNRDSFAIPDEPPLEILSSGTYTNASGTYGIGAGVVLSTGSVSTVGSSLTGTLATGYADGPNTEGGTTWAYGGVFSPDPNNPEIGVPATPGQEDLLDPITDRPDLDPPDNTFDHFDVTELIIHFDMQPGYDHVAFNVVFGSEEWPEYVDSPYIDGFGLFLNGTNIAITGGRPVNIRHPDMAYIAGTELDAVLAPGGNPLLTFGGTVNATGNTLRFIVADTSDAALDTTVYFSNLAGVPAIPLPAAGWLAAAALLACAPRIRRRVTAG